MKYLFGFAAFFGILYAALRYGYTSSWVAVVAVFAAMLTVSRFK